MRQPDNELGGPVALFGGSQVDFDGAPLLSRQGYRSPVCGRTVALLRQQEEEEFEPIRHFEFFNT